MGFLDWSGCRAGSSVSSEATLRAPRRGAPLAPRRRQARRERIRVRTSPCCMSPQHGPRVRVLESPPIPPFGRSIQHRWRGLRPEQVALCSSARSLPRAIGKAAAGVLARALLQALMCGSGHHSETFRGVFLLFVRRRAGLESERGFFFSLRKWNEIKQNVREELTGIGINLLREVRAPPETGPPGKRRTSRPRTLPGPKVRILAPNSSKCRHILELPAQ